MLVPETPITPLTSKATNEQVIAKINEVIEAINLMWNPKDGTEA